MSNRNMQLIAPVILALLFTLFIGPDCIAQTILFQDDFSSGNADLWNLQEGWQVKSDNGNYVLSGSKHSFASTGSTLWKNYSFSTKLKLNLISDLAHINYRVQGCIRYFIGFDKNQLYLHKTYPCGSDIQLMRVDDSHALNRWYTIKIVGNAGNLKVYVDDALKIEFTDPSPVISGEIAFEVFDGSNVFFDEVVVSSDDPISTTMWKSTGGPLGGLGYDVRIHPEKKNIMYVTDNFAGVGRSDNGGQTWSQANSGITIRGGTTGDAVNIFSLTVDPNNPDIIWAGTNGEGSTFGVYKSTDGGSNWTSKTNGMTLDGELGMVFRGFTIQNGNSNVVYAQAEIPTTVQGLEFNRVKGRVYKTVDGGDIWDIIWQGNNLARYLIIDPNNPEVLYLSTGIFDREAFNSDCARGSFGGLGVLKSNNGGQTWFPINNGLDDLYVGSLRMHPTNSQILFAATGNSACSGNYTGNIVSGLFKTVNGGASWTKVITKDIMTTVNFSPSSPDTIYAGSSSAFYRSEDGGAKWSRFTQPSGQGYGPIGVRAGVPIDVTVDPENPSAVYVNNYGGGVFMSLDGAKTWNLWSKGFSGAEIHIVHIPSDNPSTVYAIGRSGPFKSTNYGKDWVGIANGDATYAEWNAIVTKPSNSNIVLISDEHQGVILYSDDGGNNFSEVLRHPYAKASDPNMRQGFRALVFAPSNPNVVYAGVSKDRNTFTYSTPIGTVVYKSQNGGISFYPLPSELDGTNVRRLVVDPSNSNILYAATTSGVYKSINGAVSWTIIGYFGETYGNCYIESLAIDPNEPGYIIAGALFAGIWKTTNGGTNWTGPLNAGFNSANPYISSLVIDPSNSNIVYAGDLYSGVYQSLDKGTTWSPFPDWMMSGLTVRAVKDLAINASVIYASTQGGGVFRFDRIPLLSQTTSQFIGIWPDGVWSWNHTTKKWTKMSSTANALMISAGDVDGDKQDDLIGVWSSGLWVLQSKNSQWVKLSTSLPTWITAGDINNDGKDDVIGTWPGDGTYYRDSSTGKWFKITTPAKQLAAGNVHGDNRDDLVGVWSDGLWARYSATAGWQHLDTSIPAWIAVGDMTGNGRADIVGSYSSGTWYWNSATGGWVNLTTPAQQLAFGDIDGDGRDDLIGVWSDGVWVRYGATSKWEHITSSKPMWITTGNLASSLQSVSSQTGGEILDLSNGAPGL